ncbi:FCD domain-containing protein [Pseudomonas putida]|nr:FCD domain-containing protein [Pseudomonas putida]
MPSSSVLSAASILCSVESDFRCFCLHAVGDSCVEPDRRFHLRIAEATGNVFFIELMLRLGGLTPRNRIESTERPEANLACQAYFANREQEAIFNAMSTQVLDTATAAGRLCLSTSQNHLDDSRPRRTARDVEGRRFTAL